MKNKYKNTAIIYNPASGFGDNKNKKEQILNTAKKFGWDGELYETSKNVSSATLAKKIIDQQYKKIIICGGDGTIMEALAEILKSDIQLGIIPLGSGNLLAQNLNLDLDIRKALETAFKGKVQRIDIGKANGTLFTVMAGIGFDAEIMKKANRKMKSKYGFFAYIVTGLKHLGRRSGKYKITIDGGKGKIVKAKSIVVANMGKIQGGIEAVPSTHSQNGIFCIGVIQATSVSAWLNLVANAITGDINKSPHYQLLKGKRIEIESVRGAKPYQCDGNHFPPTKKLSVTIYPQILQVMVKK